MPRAFLHPSQRSLKTEQIGPSGHKNEYHVGVLEGNWFEERRGFGPQPQKNAVFNATTTQRLSFDDAGAEARRGAKPVEACSAEAPRELLFAHGSGEVVRSQFSTNELSFRGAKPETALTYKEITSMAGISPRREKSNSKRAESTQGAPSEVGEDGSSVVSSDGRIVLPDGTVKYHLPPIGVALTKDRFTTMKNTSIDATGEFLRENHDAYVRSMNTNSRGEFLKSLNSVMHKTNLR